MKTTKWINENKQTRNIVSFYDLSEEWQKEAISNLDDQAEEALYIEPVSDYDPNTVLMDLTECTQAKGNYNGFEYNAAIGISNNSAMLLYFDDSMSEVTFIYV